MFFSLDPGARPDPGPDPDDMFRVLPQDHLFPKHASSIQGSDFDMVRELDVACKVPLGCAASPG